MAFDRYRTLLQDEAGEISGPRTVIAGFGAGITESLLAVTPFESIKTTLYDMDAGPRGQTAIDHVTESMIVNHLIHACEASSMAPSSCSENEELGPSFKALCQQRHARQQIPPQDSVAIPL